MISAKIQRHCWPLAGWRFILLLVFFALGMVQATHASITFDEGPHLAIGYATLRTGDFRLQPVHIHPPLANTLAAAPLLLQDDLPDPRDIPGWEINSLSAITDAIVWQYPHPRRIAVAGRIPILLLGTLLGALIYRWARDVGRHSAAILALTLYAFDPNCIAHASLITTDVAAVLLIVATLYATHRWLRSRARPQQWYTLGMIGFLLGLAQLAKVSALLLIPVVGTIILIATWSAKRRLRHVLAHTTIQMAIILIFAGIVIWAGYGFEIAPVPGFPLPIPAATHLKIYLSLRQHYQLGHPTFALGHVSNHGWWWYFPLAFALKTPLPVLILGVLSLIRLTVHSGHAQQPFNQPSRLSEFLTLSLFPVSYAIAALFSTVDIGYRHLLPILPFLQVAIGTTISRHSPSSPRAQRVIHISSIILLGWLILGTVHVLPYPLTFFNEIAGGADNGYRYLVDSNLDWGQNLWDLKDWLETHNEHHIFYAHYSPARPDVYGIPADFLPPDPRAIPFAPWRPAPGLYAIGATVLQGPYAPDINTFAWFRSREPIAVLGHALFLYRVTQDTMPTWAVMCPNTLAPETVKDRLGDVKIRIIRPNCEQTQVYPGGETPGLYLLPAALEPPTGSTLLLTERDTDGHETIHVHRLDGTMPTPAHPAEPPLPMNGPLEFLGYTLLTEAAQPGGQFEVKTYWRITEIPTRPLSLMAHLVGPNNEVIGVGDGLGYSIEQWQPGDVLAQVHRFDIPQMLPTGTMLTLRIGAYWLDTMERWATKDGNINIAVAEIETQHP